MKQHKHLIIAGTVILLGTGAFAQVRKCVDTNGKITYSDTLCARETSSSEILINHNVLDSSGLRAAAIQYAEEDRKKAIANMMLSPPSECKFRYFTNNEQSKASAYAAKKECVENKFAATDGKPQSTTAQSQHNEQLNVQMNAQMNTNRQRALTSAVHQNTNSLNQNTRALESATRELQWRR